MGLLITIDPDLTAIVQYRKERAANAYHSMRPFFNRRHIATVIHTQLVRIVWILKATYECEIYGMSSARLNPIQSVINRSSWDILGCFSNYRRNVAYEELRIASKTMRSAKPRTRVITRLVNSRTTIGTSVCTPDKTRGAT